MILSKPDTFIFIFSKKYQTSVVFHLDLTLDIFEQVQNLVIFKLYMTIIKVTDQIETLSSFEDCCLFLLYSLLLPFLFPFPLFRLLPFLFFLLFSLSIIAFSFFSSSLFRLLPFYFLRLFSLSIVALSFLFPFSLFRLLLFLFFLLFSLSNFAFSFPFSSLSIATLSVRSFLHSFDYYPFFFFLFSLSIVEISFFLLYFLSIFAYSFSSCSFYLYVKKVSIFLSMFQVFILPIDQQVDVQVDIPVIFEP